MFIFRCTLWDVLGRCGKNEILTMELEYIESNQRTEQKI